MTYPVLPGRMVGGALLPQADGDTAEAITIPATERDDGGEARSYILSTLGDAGS